MKVLLALLKGIIAIYLVLVIVIFAYFYVQKEVYAVEFPFLFEYSYYKIPSDSYEPDYEKNDYVFIKEGNDAEVGDYIIYLENKNIVRFEKIIEKNNSIITIKNTSNNNENKIMDLNDVVGIADYENRLISLILSWLTEPVIIIIIFVISVLLPEVKYRDYD